MTIEEYFGDWTKVIDINKLKTLMLSVGQEYKVKTVYPAQTEVFKAFKLCPLKDLKVVMLFQDPYPQKDIATGIALANKGNTDEDKLSSSLQVLKEAVINYEIPHKRIIFDTTLETWEKQGVLMLNSALTVEANNIGSHVMLWRPFITDLLKNLSEYNTSIVYVLFGQQAKTFKPYINKKFNYIITVEHPAYFARTGTKMPYKLFKDINNIIKGLYNESIEWYKEI